MDPNGDENSDSQASIDSIPEPLTEQEDVNAINDDDPSLIRMSSTTGQLIAATPARLIAQITSPNLVDYELLSDFFLTYRTFMDAEALMTQLIARLGWAISRADDFGRIVRVRTFVALRHWILNYFIDDFISNINLRLHFCNMVNDLTRDLQIRGDINGDIRIIRELKKCWSRTCALYWNMPQSAVIGLTDEEVLPGGLIGSRNMLNEGSPPPQDEALDYRDDQNMAISQWVEEYGAAVTPSEHNHLEDSAVMFGDDEPKSAATEERIPLPSDRVADRQSMLASAHIVPQLNNQHKSSKDEESKRIHNRSGSFSDALRDDRMPLPTPKHPDYASILAAVSNIPGSLMRGTILPPPSPFLDMVVPSTPLEEQSSFSFEMKSRTSTSQEYTSGSSNSDKTVVQSHDGVKRLFVTVRRVLGTKQSSGRQTQGSTIQGPAPRPSKGNARRPFSAGPCVRQRVPKVAPILESPEPRIDLLAAGVLESYKDAVEEEMKRRNARAMGNDLVNDVQNVDFDDEYSAVGEEGTALYTSEKEDEQVTNQEQEITEQDVNAYDLYDNGSGAQAHAVEICPIHQVQARRHSMPSSLDSRAFAHNGALTVDPTAVSEQAAGGSIENKHVRNEELEIIPGPYIKESGEALCYEDKIDHEGYIDYAEPETNEGDASGLFCDTISDTNDAFYLDCSLVCGSKDQTDNKLQKTTSHDNDDYIADSSTGNLQQDQIPIIPTSTRIRSIHSSSMIDNKAKTISLMSTHSSQPGNRGSSYDKEVAQLALLPDIVDGSIESALLRLEGRYESQMTSSPTRLTGRDNVNSPEGESSSLVFSSFGQTVLSSQTDIHAHEDQQQDLSHWRHEEEMSGRKLVPPIFAREVVSMNREHELQRSSVATSLGSYSSTPLLERDLSFHGVKRKASKSNPAYDLTQQVSAGKMETSGGQETTVPAERLEHPPGRRVAAPVPDVRSMESSGSSTALQSNAQNQAPSNSPEDHRPSSSSNVVIEEEEKSIRPRLVNDTADTGVEAETTCIPEESPVAGVSEGIPHPVHHPTTSQPARRKLAQPLMTILPPTLNASSSRHSRHVPLQPRIDQQIIAAKKNAVTVITPSKNAADVSKQGLHKICIDTPLANHMPFIMGYDSLTVAQQMTLCEKDALSEIDWRELIEIRWTQTSPTVRDWVELLKLSGDSPRDQSLRGGVDICTARFNIMVKWTMSEIVLTKNIKERAACIVKFIHVAQHARQLRNWATMYQITTALVNSDCSRLKQTWALVPYQEQETLDSLEALIMPMRNFHNLRMEIERTFNDASEGDVGCIPFVGIYTHDLIYNAQKPAFLPNTDGGAHAEPLVNFERLHTAAAIVKNLLRLLEASSKYTFLPIPEVLSRCVWLATLSDEEISRRSELLEPL